MKRQARVERATRETEITVSLDLDRAGPAEIRTGIGFLDHMLTLFAVHGAFGLELAAKGDLEVDAHHTVEDVGICLGEALRKALGRPEGIRRYGHAVVPMDEALAEVALDLSGRPYLAYECPFPGSMVGDFPTELLEEFLRAFANHGALTLHVILRRGRNNHHIAEAVFKALGRALREAVSQDSRIHGIPSSKGSL